MRKFLIRISLFCVPLLVPVLLYVLIDPYMTVGSNRGKLNVTEEYDIAGNRDFQTTELFLKNQRKEQYNAFILGNSRSFFYRAATWQQYIDGKIYHFNASSETLFGIERKLRYLQAENIPIKHALIVMDHHALSHTYNSTGHQYMKHPATSGESTMRLYSEMFKAFFPKATLAYLDLYLTNERKPYMEQYGVREPKWKLDPQTNELTYFVFDQMLAENPDQYYKEKRGIFYEREANPEPYEPAIAERQEKLLQSMKTILDSCGTDYRLVINPLYDQKQLDRGDLRYLQQLFGADRIFDFSGVNPITNNYRNYYETSHYRPVVSDSIIKLMYQ